MSFRSRPIQPVEQLHQLHGAEPELRALAAALGPAARAFGSQLDPDARGRRDTHLVRHLEQHLQLGELLQDDDHLVPQLLAHQGQAHELLVLVAVADDQVIAGFAQAEHRLELGLAAALEPHPVGRPELDDLLDHVPLLVHLDRIDRGVAALVPELLDRVAEFGGERLNPGLQDVGEAEQQREPDALGVEVHGQPVEIEPALLVGVRVHGDVPLGVGAEVSQAPAAHVVQLLGVFGGPGRGGDDSGDGAAPRGSRRKTL